MKKSLYLVGLAMMAAGAMLTGCQDSYENVADNNKVWDPTVDRVALTLLEGKDNELVKTFGVTMAQREAFNVNVEYAVVPEMVEVYNEIYNSNAVILPEENYVFDENKVTIPAGATNSTNAQITFTDLLDLDTDLIYVLPVSIVSSNIETLKSRETTYYVFRGAALINVVGNMTGTCMRFVNEGQCPELQSLRQLTFEALLRPDAFPHTLSTLIGIEGKFLIRVGDAGVPADQIQLATSNGNVTDPAWKLPVAAWTFVTMTIDLDSHEVNVYFNGVKKGATQSTSYSDPINWNVVSNDRACYIGYAYDTDRDFQGDISEMRVWNKILTVADLAARNHFYRVDTDSEGLVAYWKFDEGAGNLVHDYANGYDMYVPATYPGKASAPGDLKWNPVTLP